MNYKKIALFIIDMQNDFVLSTSESSINRAQKIVPAIASVLTLFRKLDLPIFHIIREYRADGSDIEQFRFQRFMEGDKKAVQGTIGCQIVESLRPQDTEYIIVKQRFSGFMNTELEFILRRLEVSEIVITGTQYPNCVRATIYDAIAYGYNVTLLTDATSAKSEDIEKANIRDLKNIGVNCIRSIELKM